ncbi:NAD(P)/FAD-dependent oxidoreductase (plasmid) [Roseobacteraceae bacterium NS-SX3]
MGERFVVIGGGFYGICLALFLRSLSSHVVLLEKEQVLFTRASFANQARIHAGFHYPRSFATARRSTILSRRFIADFGAAVRADFQMLYAIARHGSKTTAGRFLQMYQQLGAGIRPASPSESALFDARMVEAVFACEEAAFDASALRSVLQERLAAAGIEVRTGVEAQAAAPDPGGGLRVSLADGGSCRADIVFNATYARLNHIALPDPPERVPVKNELTEIALVDPGAAMEGLAVTVMDGPFFSLMPFPARQCYSLTHVRYTPQFSWGYGGGPMRSPTVIAPRPRWVNMARDAARYVPATADVRWRESLFVTKTVPVKNEFDDGRPILLHAHRSLPGFFSVLGGKIDNVYDLFSVLPGVSPVFSGAHPGWLLGRCRG